MAKPLTDRRRHVLVPQPSAKPVTVLLRIEQERGCYGGAALAGADQAGLRPGPDRALGDWSKNDGLLSYSGGAWYRKTSHPCRQAGRSRPGRRRRVRRGPCNGQPAGVKVSPPWTLDITKFVKPGGNRIEVLVCNTLANHYTTVPRVIAGRPPPDCSARCEIRMSR